MKRSSVIQQVLDLYKMPRYLEIGVNRGETFFDLEAARKIAVDPKFLFDVSEGKKKDPRAIFHQCQSDVYFSNIDQNEKFEVIYLDGLHTFEQTLRDFCNSILFLAPDGVIIVDDIFPNSYASALPNLDHARQLKMHESPSNPDLSWMGDVYKLVVFIGEFFQQFSYCCITDNHGQMIVWRGARSETEASNRLVSEVGNLPYESVVIDRKSFRWTTFDEIFPQLKVAIGK